MKKFFEILKAHKYAILWTICYIFAMWAILQFMFNFSIFNGAQWAKLARAELHGFAGFVFGLLILSALPMYIATTTLIIRNKKPLITIPMPKISLQKTSKEIETKTPAPSETPQPAEKEEEKLPDDLPPELHGVFIRARNRISAYEQSTATTDTQTPDIAATESQAALPLPADFDLQLNDIPGMDSAPDFTAPVFTDITFGDDTETEPHTENDISDNQKLIDYLTNTGTPFNITSDIITTDTHAIITHSDSDFWVIDNENWFANGKTRPSPINKIKDFAIEHGLIPVIYLESKNIMDIDTHIKSWQTDGIIVIASPEEIQE